MDKIIQKYISYLEQNISVDEYDDLIEEIISDMIGKQEFQIVKEIQFKANYISNKFSDESTIENMEKSKQSLLIYLRELVSENIQADKISVFLERYLDNFYCFMEILREKVPDKRATLCKEDLSKITVCNEYDLQHLLYAAVKPLYPDARAEVTEDTGFAAVRSDIWISSIRAVIEAKCTRNKMTEKKLIEEIEADIVHYDADYIFFYIYDKYKIVKNKQAFETTFNKKFDDKYIHVILQQPIYM